VEIGCPCKHFRLRGAPTGDAYWTAAESIYHRSPAPDGKTEEIGRVPAGLFGERQIRQIVTLLTLSADGGAFNLDVKTGDRWYLGVREKARCWAG